MANRPDTTRSNKGYITIEVMAVTLMLVIVLTAALFFYEGVLRAARSSSQQATLQQNARTALEFITGDMHLAHRIDLHPGGAGMNYRLPGEPVQWTIRHRPDNTLVRERRPISPEGIVGDVSDTLLVASHITEFRIAYTLNIFTWQVAITARQGDQYVALAGTVSPRNLR